MALVPDQAPEAVQEVALVDDQVRVELPPLAMGSGSPRGSLSGRGPVR